MDPDPTAKNELYIQGTTAIVICVCATIAAIADVIGSSALIGVFGAALAYVFGAGVGSRLARPKNGAAATIERRAATDGEKR